MDASAINLQQHLPYRLAVLSNTVRQFTSEQYSQSLGLNVREWRVITLLGNTEPLTAQDVSKRTGMDKATISRALKSLLERDLLTKTPHPSDGRSYFVSLSEQGQNAWAKVKPDMVQSGADMASVLSPGELTLFLELLDKLQDKAGQILQDK